MAPCWLTLQWYTFVTNWTWGGEKLVCQLARWGRPSPQPDSRVVLGDADVDVEYAALVRRASGARNRRSPLEDVALIGRKRDGTEILAREVRDLV
jgi:hypothetical protein